MKKIEGCIFHLDYILNYSKNSTGLRDIKRFLINLRMSGMKLGVASKNTTIVDVLKVLQLEDFFDVILDNGDLNLNFKPLLLRTAERLKISPENCVVFDNETDGLNDAKMLNMSAIGIGNNIPTSIADKMVPNFSNVNSSILNFN
ncbi:HAD hydrolase-like protein [Clostridium arbusti]|uniref:HAD hydrolase-like protein n=1 Tax=Clostridium arbusti TaxID=1137848 RepID=UPI000287C72A|nr:HAD hydrolase-like protein [Clostridium arbusti]